MLLGTLPVPVPSELSLLGSPGVVSSSWMGWACNECEVSVGVALMAWPLRTYDDTDDGVVHAELIESWDKRLSSDPRWCRCVSHSLANDRVGAGLHARVEGSAATSSGQYPRRTLPIRDKHSRVEVEGIRETTLGSAGIVLVSVRVSDSTLSRITLTVGSAAA